jgi:ankyrin repeat protein
LFFWVCPPTIHDRKKKALFLQAILKPWFVMYLYLIFPWCCIPLVLKAQPEKELWNAVYRGNAFQVNYLIIHQRLDPNQRDSSGKTPLMYAAQHNYLPMVRVLFSHKVYPYIQDTKGWTALHWACLSDEHLEVVKVFLKHAGYPLVKTRNGRTALQIADSTGAYTLLPVLRKQLDQDFNRCVAEGDSIKVTDFILAGANVDNPYGSSQQTPLHTAVWTNQPSVVRILLEKGSFPDKQDRNGNTPLHLAAMRGDSHEEVVRLLLAYKATLLNNKSKLSPLQIARRLEHPLLTKLLESVQVK